MSLTYIEIPFCHNKKMNTFRFLEWIIDAFYHFLKLSRLICKLFLRYCITVGKTNVVKIVIYQICKYRYVFRMKQTTINFSIKMNQAGDEYLIENLTYILMIVYFWGRKKVFFFIFFHLNLFSMCHVMKFLRVCMLTTLMKFWFVQD